MSMPSITIRLDFGDSSSSGAISLQGTAPTPMSFGSGVGSMSWQGGMSDSEAPTPFANATAAAAVQDAAPTPMSGIGAMSSAAMSRTPPEPSPDMAGGAQASGMIDAPPHPEGEPGGETKKPANKR